MRLILAVGARRSIAKPRSNIFWEAIWAAIESPPLVAVGTRFSSRPPHRTVRAAFPHTACMGVSLSRVHHAIFVVLCCFILLFDPCREHSSKIGRAHV